MCSLHAAKYFVPKLYLWTTQHGADIRHVVTTSTHTHTHRPLPFLRVRFVCGIFTHFLKWLGDGECISFGASFNRILWMIWNGALRGDIEKVKVFGFCVAYFGWNVCLVNNIQSSSTVFAVVKLTRHTFTCLQYSLGGRLHTLRYIYIYMGFVDFSI